MKNGAIFLLIFFTGCISAQKYGTSVEIKKDIDMVGKSKKQILASLSNFKIEQGKDEEGNDAIRYRRHHTILGSDAFVFRTLSFKHDTCVDLKIRSRRQSIVHDCQKLNESRGPVPRNDVSTLRWECSSDDAREYILEYVKNDFK